MKGDHLLLIAGALVVLLFNGCTEEANQEYRRELVIGISLDSLVVERWANDLRELEKNARSLGARVIKRVALGNTEKQKMDLKELMDAGANVLVVVPSQADGLAGEMELAQSRGIPVISYDRLILGAPISAYVSFDTRQVGREMAQGYLNESGGGDLILINGGANDHNSLLLNQGIMEVLGPAILQERVRLLEEFWPNTWSTSEFSQELELLVRSGKPLNGILAGNDQFATEAIRVLNRSGDRQNVLVFGQDADLVACQNIALGFQSGTVYKPITLLAKKAMELAFQLAIGEGLMASQHIQNGSMEVPVFYISPIYVDRTNLRDFLESTSYHELQDVYAFVESPLSQ